MTQDEIIRMAREAGALVFQSNFCNSSFDFNSEQLERFAALVAAHEKKFWMEQIEVECNEAVLAEREACANVCEELPKIRTTTDGGLGVSGIVGKHLAASIRARGEE